MSYFRLYPDCHFTDGPSRSTLHIISKTRTIHLSEFHTKILRMLLGNNNLEEVKWEFGPETDKIVADYIKKGYGTLYDSPVYCEPYFPNCRFELRGFFEPAPLTRTAFIQLSNKCNVKCSYCNNKNYYNVQGCNSCLKWVEGGGKSDEMNLSKLKKTLDVLTDLNVPNVIFSGGNPLLDWDELINITKYLKQTNEQIKIKVNTNGFGFDKKIVEQAKIYDIEFCFSILGTNEDEYYLTTGERDLFYKVVEAVKICNEYDIIYSLNLVIFPPIKTIVQKLYDFAFELGGINLFTSEVLAKNDRKERIVSLPTGSRRIEDIGAKEFYMRNKYNFCLNGNVAIAANGSILPCPSWNTDIGNIYTDKDLFYVFRNGVINLYWETPKSLMPVCKSCENRFACVDCSVLEWELNKDTTVQRVFCDYSPEQGVWHEGKEL